MVAIDGSTAVVTGGGRGLGKAIVAELIKRGAAKVYATSRSPEPSDDYRVLATACDVTDTDSVTALAARATDATIVVNNAGTNGGRPLLSTGDFDAIREVFETNYFGALRVARAFAPVLGLNGGGVLVDIHSVLSWMSARGAYPSSKAALWSATNSLRIELASQHTLVTGVHVGYIDTDMTLGLDVAKIAPKDVASKIIDGVENGETEVLVDALSRYYKTAVAGPVEGLQQQ